MLVQPLVHKNVAFWRILRCGSSSIVGHLYRRGFRKQSRAPEGGVSAAVIRDPLDRWISGLYQLQKDERADWSVIFGEVLERLRDGEVFTHNGNSHVQAQSEYLAEAPPDIALFALDDLEGLERWFRQHGYRFSFGHENCSDPADLTWAHQQLTDQDRAIVYDHYQADVELWLGTQFLNAR